MPTEIFTWLLFHASNWIDEICESRSGVFRKRCERFRCGAWNGHNTQNERFHSIPCLLSLSFSLSPGFSSMYELIYCFIILFYDRLYGLRCHFNCSAVEMYTVVFFYSSIRNGPHWIVAHISMDFRFQWIKKPNRFFPSSQLYRVCVLSVAASFLWSFLFGEFEKRGTKRLCSTLKSMCAKKEINLVNHICMRCRIWEPTRRIEKQENPTDITWTM